MATPAWAIADSSVTYAGNGTSGTLTVVGDSIDNAYTLTATTSAGMIVALAIQDGNGQVASPGAPCSQTTATMVTCMADGTHALTSVTIAGGDGEDRLSTASLPIGFPTTFNGENGDDRLDANGEEDIFNGGAGYDLVSYDALVGPANVSANGVANDGEPGETDNIGTEWRRSSVAMVQTS